MPVAVGVMATEQEPFVSVQLPLGAKVTLPVGVIVAPGAVSVTVTVHDVD